MLVVDELSAAYAAVRTNAAADITSIGFRLEVAGALAPCFGASAIRAGSDLLNYRPAEQEVFEHLNSSEVTNSNYEGCDAEGVGVVVL